jgi:replication initiation protein RepC
MTHETTTRAGLARDRGPAPYHRPGRPPCPAPRAAAEPELRWRLLDQLAQAREEWGLKDRSLQVLRALLSFLPRGERVRLVVFPSNRRLQERLLGMPESTLRRHLARLAEAGLLRRRPSPNGKRYRVGQDPDLAFGFDLGPFFAAGARIADRAAAWAERRLEAAELRAHLRRRLDALPPDDPAQAQRPLLRRKPQADALRAALAALPPETAVAAARNGRHIDHQAQEDLQRQAGPDAAADAVRELEAVTGQRVATASHLHAAGRRLAAMLGTGEAWHGAETRHGPEWAALAHVYLLRRAGTLRSPRAYLASLTAAAATGGFDLLSALAGTGGWAPDAETGAGAGAGDIRAAPS